MNIQQAVALADTTLRAHHVESPRLSAELLAAHVTSLTRSQVLAKGDRSLSLEEESAFRAALARRVRHEPVPYITGETEFYSLPFSIVPGVFIPRPETETLVDAALAAARGLDHPPTIGDLGTGCGTILVSLAYHLEAGEVWGCDLSPTALRVAAANARRHHLENRVMLREGSLFDPFRPIAGRIFDVLVSNPPYIKSGDIPALAKQIRDFEPLPALDGGPDGLTCIRAILEDAADFLRPGGFLFLEAEPGLMPKIEEEAKRRGYVDFVVHQDASGKERVAQCRTPD
ncbi:MAG TPA: peptide chain release factor N(5)-glutamine methyltransferase [bacterium]|nr:peptide chain release factor N(5)-glutamine methyltransferase [Candidatus Omnitrophota bacterium]HOJ61640.1 peptide chain release factor N(5)-glutamine methyltransferase [bacterium]HOL94793.1 peptide chain release factor N(5)-glutamine methyltransferase [bacterium]